jgi:UrcA family protein
MNKSIAALFCLAAFAANAADLKSRTVFFHDLNVSSPAGAKVLYSRITTAAKQVCPGTGERGISANAKRQACIAAAVEKAVSDVNRPLLSALHDRSTIRTASR